MQGKIYQFEDYLLDVSEQRLQKNGESILLPPKVFEVLTALIKRPGQLITYRELMEEVWPETFVEETGVGALAIAIGTAHGFYKEEPKLQFELLADIRSRINSILVLHGGSGVPAAQLQQAISLGICKVNLATEIKNIFMKTLQSVLKGTEEIDLRKVFPKATNSVTELVKEKLRIVQNN